MTPETLYSMELHEVHDVNPLMDVMKVAGGWIYTQYSDETGLATLATFVPMHNEFQPKTRKKRVQQGWAEQVVSIYHARLSGLPKVATLTEKRKVAIRKLTESHLKTLEDWEAYFMDASTKNFLFGVNDRKWVADFDFFLREGTIAKMQEGKYDNR